MNLNSPYVGQMINVSLQFKILFLPSFNLFFFHRRTRVRCASVDHRAKPWRRRDLNAQWTIRLVNGRSSIWAKKPSSHPFDARKLGSIHRSITSFWKQQRVITSKSKPWRVCPRYLWLVITSLYKSSLVKASNLIDSYLVQSLNVF